MCNKTHIADFKESTKITKKKKKKLSCFSFVGRNIRILTDIYKTAQKEFILQGASTHHLRK